ncbi:MAG: aldo/keto reductase, partial [Saprospiraceae bacterium]|nr:aldo/keto reductase [Saprospiraceae bacterium]
MKKLIFQNGDAMPALGLGTWQAPRGEVGAAVREAIHIGYRHIDCAAIYGNEKEIGEALEAAFKAGEVRRDELWITSKLWNSRHGQANVRPALEKTLADLRLDYLDLYLIHWPVPMKHVVPHVPNQFLTLEEQPIADTWLGMEEVMEAGLTHHIGVSNFSIKKLKLLLETAHHHPEVNQVEMHPLLAQNELKAFCDAAQIKMTAYCPLGRPGSTELAPNSPDLLGDPTVRQIAEQHQCTPAQVVLAWAMERGTSPIPKSTNPGRLAENFASQHLHLAEKDMDALNQLDRHFRYVDGSFWVVPGGP